MKYLMSSSHVISLVVLSACVLMCSSCFIRNCPTGGKRSSMGVATVHARRECLRCGPGGLGQCVGPSTCCGEAIGCYLNTAESKVCARENENLTPCRVLGETCGQGEGKCVADSVCCTDEGCRIDSTCEAKEDYAPDYASNDVTPDLLQYVKRLLASKALSDFGKK